MASDSNASWIKELDSLSSAAGALDFRVLADAMPLMVWTALVDGRLDFVNLKVLEYFGQTYEKMVGEGWMGVLHPDDVAPTIEAWTRSLQTGELYDHAFRVFRGADRQCRWCEVRAQPLRDAQGKIVRWLGTTTDVHESRLARAALESIEARYRLYTESTGEGLWYWDLVTNQVELSRRSYALVGLSPDAPSGDPRHFGGVIQSFFELVHPDDRDSVQAALQGHLERGERYRHELRMRVGTGGEYRHFMAHGVAGRNESGAPIHMAGGLVDLTAQKEAEATLNERLATIEMQAESIRQLSTPIIEVWDGVLTMPLLGILDADRAGRMMEVLLQTAVERQCRYTIVDLTGVSAMDEATVGYVGRMLSALSLLGAKGIIVGIRPEVAQTMVSLELGLKGVTMLRNLRQALLFCMRALGQVSTA